MEKILIATTNRGKFKEFMVEFADLPFTFVSLRDVHLDKANIDEPFATTEENAIHKARFFSHKSKLPTIAEDTGFFVKHLQGQPGIKAKRFAATPEERRAKILSGLKGMPRIKRAAYFETSACFYNPKNDSFSVFRGRMNGLIAQKELKIKLPEGMAYDSIFYYPPAKKMMAAMSPEEKNLISHRGQTAAQLKYFLAREFGPQRLVVAGALLIKNRRFFMQKRRDPRPKFNNTWEFPGGIVENGEQIKDAIRRELKEETGYCIRFVEPLPHLYNYNVTPALQIFLYVYICTIRSGQYHPATGEVVGHGWFTHQKALKQRLISNNGRILEENKVLLKKYID
ncbi:MAG: NUDIX domain-containing protein [Candidatus Magasanikbacteria bacterium]|nr:NUDIX domain-containing protein [Candidatus Magasanikbacteria bacterium]